MTYTERQNQEAELYLVYSTREAIALERRTADRLLDAWASRTFRIIENLRLREEWNQE